VVYAHTTAYTHILLLYAEVCVQQIPVHNTLYQSIRIRLQYIYRITIIVMCVYFRSGDEFLRDVRPDRTNRAFLILLLLFYARALHILCLNYTAVGRTRCGPALPSDRTYTTVRDDFHCIHIIILVYYICVMMVYRTLSGPKV